MISSSGWRWTLRREDRRRLPGSPRLGRLNTLIRPASGLYEEEKREDAHDEQRFRHHRLDHLQKRQLSGLGHEKCLLSSVRQTFLDVRAEGPRRPLLHAPRGGAP